MGQPTLLLESELNSQTLIEKIDSILLKSEKTTEMKAAAKKLGIPDAAKRVYSVMKEIAK